MIQEDLEIEDVDDESFYLRELSKLEKKLAIATTALKYIKVYSQRDWDEYNCMECADKALKEMECIK